MTVHTLKKAAIATACSFALVLSSGVTVAADDNEEMREDANDAVEQVTEASRLLQQMKRSPELAAVLERSRGVFLVPDSTVA